MKELDEILKLLAEGYEKNIDVDRIVVDSQLWIRLKANVQEVSLNDIGEKLFGVKLVEWPLLNGGPVSYAFLDKDGKLLQL